MSNNDVIVTSEETTTVGNGDNNNSGGLVGIWNAVYNSTQTPIPALTASAGLISTLTVDHPAYKPSRASVLGFGGAFALGGYMIYDGDLVNGAGFTSAWSILYLMVNGKAALKQMKVLPLGIAGVVSFNAIGYGREFFYPRTPVEGFSI